MFLLFPACAEPTDEQAEAPTLQWLSPSDGERVAAGELSCAVILESFSLLDPAKHNDGAPIGYVGITVDAQPVLELGSTTFTLSLGVGAHELGATLYYADGDEVRAKEGALCEEEGCEPIQARVGVQAE
jgi:hypothetical protein